MEEYPDKNVIATLSDIGFAYVNIDYNDTMGMGCDECVHVLTFKDVRICVAYGSGPEEVIRSLSGYGQSGGAGLEIFGVRLDDICSATSYIWKIEKQKEN